LATRGQPHPQPLPTALSTFIGRAPELAETLRPACPNLRILATSRETLHLLHNDHDDVRRGQQRGQAHRCVSARHRLGAHCPTES